MESRQYIAATVAGALATAGAVAASIMYVEEHFSDVHSAIAEAVEDVSERTVTANEVLEDHVAGAVRDLNYRLGRYHGECMSASALSPR